MYCLVYLPMPGKKIRINKWPNIFLIANKLHKIQCGLRRSCIIIFSDTVYAYIFSSNTQELYTLDMNTRMLFYVEQRGCHVYGAQEHLGVWYLAQGHPGSALEVDWQSGTSPAARPHSVFWPADSGDCSHRLSYCCLKQGSDHGELQGALFLSKKLTWFCFFSLLYFPVKLF